jgi:hypothetical protein
MPRRDERREMVLVIDEVGLRRIRRVTRLRICMSIERMRYDIEFGIAGDCLELGWNLYV